MKKRLDVLLVERGLAESRAQAQALVLAGLVPGHSKAGEQLPEDAPLEVESPSTRTASTPSISARRPAASPTFCSSAALRGSSRSTSATASCTRESAATPASPFSNGRMPAS
jgi:hypothetical protein